MQWVRKSACQAIKREAYYLCRKIFGIFSSRTNKQRYLLLVNIHLFRLFMRKVAKKDIPVHLNYKQLTRPLMLIVNRMLGKENIFTLKLSASAFPLRRIL